MPGTDPGGRGSVLGPRIDPLSRSPAPHGFPFVAGVAVVAVPRGLPRVTLPRAIGAQPIAAERALIRHPEAPETPDSGPVISAGKTRTLPAPQHVRRGDPVDR